MSLLLLKALRSSSHSQCPALLFRPPGFRTSCCSSPLRRAPHPCCWASGAPPPPSPPPLHLLLLPSRPVSLLFSKERRPSPFPWLPVRHQQNTPPRISSQRFSTLARCLTLPLVSSGPGSGSGGALLMERSSRERPPPYKRWRSTGESKGEGKGDCAAATAAEGSGRRAAETRPGREPGALDHEAGAPRSKSWSSDPGGEGRTSENHQKGERREESKWKGNRKKRDREGGVGQGQTHHRMERPPPPQPPPQPHTVDHKPNPWLLAGAPQRTYPPPPGWRHPGPPPPPGPLRNAQPPPVTLRDPPPPPPSNAPPATGAWGNAPPATLRNPTPPPPGTLGNPEDFPPLSRSGPPPQTTQSQKTSAQPLQRHWELSPAHRTADCATGSFDFSVMSYNILSQDLLHDNAYLYRHCDPAVLPWDFRLPNLLREIKLYHADVLCLQEVQEDHYKAQMKPALETLGYQCVYKKRTGKKPEGCAIAFKSSRLSLVSAHPLEYLRPGDALLDRDNVGLVLLLRPGDGGGVGQSDPSDFICVANTHLLYNPRRGDIKLAQLAILLAEISRLSRLPDGSSNPVLVCGDFNSTPWSPLYTFLTQGCLEFKGLPISMVSGQEDGRGQRVLTAPIWSKSLGINQNCCYDNLPASQPSSSSPTEVEGDVSTLTVEQLTANALASYSRTRLRHSVGLRSAYSHLLMPDGRVAITTCHSRTAMTVDYILYTPDAQTSRSLPGGRGLQLLARLSLVGQSELKAVNGLPNQHHSSDHLPILARFRLRR